MSFKSAWLRFGTSNRHSGFMAWPERAARPLPAVVVIQEAWGVDGHIEDVTLRLAKAGYAALAPDLFSDNGERPPVFSRERMEMLKEFVGTLPPGVWGDPKARDEAMSRLPEPRRAQVTESFRALFGGVLGKLDALVPKLVDAARFLRSEHEATRGAKVACAGFCMGGGLSALLACSDAELAGAAIYYGSSPPAELVPKISCPIVGFYGGTDARINGGVPAFAEAMTTAGKSFEQTTYEGAAHGFFNDTRASYDARATRDSFARLLTFLERTIAA
jgi:carboxymethylenebutenolidase